MKSLVQLILDNPNNGIDEYIEKFHSPAFRINDSNEINSIENTSMNESKTILEGKKYDIILSTHERKPEAREQCINYFREKIGNLYCIICKFDFEKTYGTIGKNYIHIHHINPLSSVDSEREVNPKKDLVPVCPNCHAMLHKKSPPFSVEDLKIIMKIAQKKR
jgi:5-methylcytosine-specific restriction protein A